MRCTSLGECHHLSITSWLTSAERCYFKLFTWGCFPLLLYVVVCLMTSISDKVSSINMSLSQSMPQLLYPPLPVVISSCAFELQPRCRLQAHMHHRGIWASRTIQSWSFAIRWNRIRIAFIDISGYYCTVPITCIFSTFQPSNCWCWHQPRRFTFFLPLCDQKIQLPENYVHTKDLGNYAPI